MNKTKKMLAVLLVVAMVLPCVAVSMPTAIALDAEELAESISTRTGLTALANSDTEVTVSGTRTNLTTALDLEIPVGVTLNWGASLTGSLKSGFLVNLQGGGTFNLSPGGTISNTGTGGQINIAGAGLTMSIAGTLSKNTTGISLNIAADNVTLNVTGTIENSGSSSAININPGLAGIVINVGSASSGGSVVSKTGGYAINDGGGTDPCSNDTEITIVNGSIIEAEGACAIRSTGKDSNVTIIDSTVQNNAASNTNSTIYMNCGNDGTGGNVIIGGNSIVKTLNEGTQSYVIQATGNVTVTDNATVSAINGRAINLVGRNSTATVTGGVVETRNGTAICTATTDPTTVTNAKVFISGGIVRATDSGTAVRITGAGGTVDITGGWVTANQGFAVDASGSPAANSVTVSGGFVFAWGTGTNKAVNKLNPTSTGIVATWNTTTGEGTYNQDTTTDLAVFPSTPGLANWDIDTSRDRGGTAPYYGGLYFANNANGTDFFPLGAEIIQTLFTLTIVNGKSSGLETLTVPVGASVSIVADAEKPIVSAPAYLYEDGTPNGNAFVGWTTNDGILADEAAATTTFIMPRNNATVTAGFKDRYLLHVDSGNSIINQRNFGGSLNYGFYPEGAGILIGRDSWTMMSGGQTVYFDGWTSSHGGAFVDSGALKTTFIMPAGYTLVSAIPVATLASLPSFAQVSVTSGPGTSGNSGITGTTAGASYAPAITQGSYQKGTGLRITAAAPEDRFEFAGWTSTGGGYFQDALSLSTVYVTPGDDVTIVANYTRKTPMYNLTVEGGTVNSPSSPYNAGDRITVTADPAPTGMRFSGWTYSDGEFDNNIQRADAVFTMPEGDAVITANYEWIEYALTVVGGIDDSGAGLYHYGEDIRIIAVPPLGMMLEQWTTNAGGTFARDTGAITTFRMPENDVTVTAHFVQGIRQDDGSYSPFSKEHIAYISGYPDGTVHPERDVTRAEVAMVFYRLLTDEMRGDEWHDESQFPDVESGEWYSAAITEMHNWGIINGYPDGLYRPNGSITRAELATITAHFAIRMHMEHINHLSFSDITGHWASSNIVLVSEVGWMNGYPDSSFKPNQNITRAEFMTLVNRMLERVPETVDDLLIDEMIRWPDNADPDAWYYIAIQEATNSHTAEYKEVAVRGLQFNYEYWIEMME